MLINFHSFLWVDLEMRGGWLCFDSLSFTSSSPLFCSEVYSSAAEGRTPSIRESKLIGFDNLAVHGCNACNDCSGTLYSMVVMFVMIVMGPYIPWL